MIDVAAVRADTPGCENFIHFNNAGASLAPASVVEAQVDYLRGEAATGGYELAADRADDFDRFYTATGRLLGCDPQEVAFTSGASESWWRAFSSVPLEAGDVVLASSAEFQSNAFGLLQARDRGVDVRLIPNGPDGLIDLDEFRHLLTDAVRLVCVTQVSMSNGAVQPVAAVGDLLRGHDALYLLDACQAVGQLAVDVDEIGCDFLAYTGRKWMRGPRGTGVLYCRSDVLDRIGPHPFIDGRSAVWHDDDTFSYAPGAQRFEFGEHNYAGKIGLAVATEYVLDLGIAAVEQRIGALAAALRSGLAGLDGVDVVDEGGPRSGIVTFTVNGTATPAMGASLRRSGLQLSAPGRANAQWDIGARGIDTVLRAAVHYYNTEDEVSRAVELIAELQSS